MDRVLAALADPLTQTFCWGFLGSAAVEVAFVLRCMERGRIPARFKTFWFWFLRMVLAAIAGALAIAYGVQTPFIAFQIGAATPLILTQLTQRNPTAPAD